MHDTEVYTLDSHSTEDEIEDFYTMYIESFKDLCIYQGQQIIDLADYLSPTGSFRKFTSELDIVIRELGIIIYYTHNNDIITSIAFVEMEPREKCYVEIKFLCNNQLVRPSSPMGEKSAATSLLDYIFDLYNDKVILIQPATPELIPYYTKYRKASFPYSSNDLKETFGYLVFGKITRLKESCFGKIFISIKIINDLVQMLNFKSINDLYNNTHDLNSLKEKLITKLDYSVKTTKEIKPIYYEKILDKIINGIKFYDIGDIIDYSIQSKKQSTPATGSVSGGRKKKTRTKATKTKRKKRTKTQKKI